MSNNEYQWKARGGVEGLCVSEHGCRCPPASAVPAEMFARGNMGYTAHDVLCWVPADVTQPGGRPWTAQATLLLSRCSRRSRGSRGSRNYVINFLKACFLSGGTLETRLGGESHGFEGLTG